MGMAVFGFSKVHGYTYVLQLTRSGRIEVGIHSAEEYQRLYYHTNEENER